MSIERLRTYLLPLVLFLAGSVPGRAQEVAAPPVPVEARPFFFALSVRDVEASAAWYEGTFGFATMRSVDLAERGIRVRILGLEGALLEIVELPQARSRSELEPAVESAHLVHGVFKIGFEVVDLDQALRRLEAVGIEPRGDPFTEADGSMRSAQIEDPDGNIVQLFERLGGSGLSASPPVHHLDELAREPMVVRHPSGVLFVAGYGSQVTGTNPEASPRLWKSMDGGSTWERVGVGTAEEGAAGNSDVDLAVGPDGTLYFVVMGFDRTTREGTHIAVGASRDLGASWRWTRLSETRFDDRPWVEVTPDGTAHAVWNDDRGVSYATSSDRGDTWTEHERIHSEGGSSHLAVGPNGEVAVRISPIAASANRFFEKADLVAVSTDGGSTWMKYQAPGERDWDPTFSRSDTIPRWVEPLAWDAAGALYSLWSEGSRVRLARSRDRGEAWETWTVLEEAGPAYFPYLVGRGSGELAATWFVGAGDETAVRVVAIEVPGDGEAPLEVRRADPFPIDAWNEVEGPAPGRTPAGEYVPVVFLDDGRLGVVSPIQDKPHDRWGFTWWVVAD